MSEGDRLRGSTAWVSPVALRAAVAVIAAAGLAIMAVRLGRVTSSPHSSSNVASVASAATSHGSSGPTAQSGRPQGQPLAQTVALEREYLQFASCMRSHAVSDFPDPVIGSGGHPGFRLVGGSKSDLNPNSPTFQGAVEACQQVLGHRFAFGFATSGIGKGA
jgi:hypothetical protein